MTTAMTSYYSKNSKVFALCIFHSEHLWPSCTTYHLQVANFLYQVFLSCLFFNGKPISACIAGISHFIPWLGQGMAVWRGSDICRELKIMPLPLLHWKNPALVIWAPDWNTSWMPPFGGLWSGKRPPDPGSTGGIIWIPFDLGKPWGPPGGAGKCCWAEGCLE